jgi:hypothetical protein
MSGTTIAVYDIDGVLADARHREHLVATKPKDWDGFFAAVGDDAAIEEGLADLRDSAGTHRIVLVSGRPERTRADTEAWLARQGVPYDRLVLRRDSDRRPAALAKADLLRTLGGADVVVLVVDDDASVVERLGGLGYHAVHFAPLAD